MQAPAALPDTLEQLESMRERPSHGQGIPRPASRPKFFPIARRRSASGGGITRVFWTSLLVQCSKETFPR